MKAEILIIGTDCDSTWIIANYLSNNYEIKQILIEKKVSKIKLVNNRIKKLGYLRVVGQLCFQLLLYPIILQISQRRIKEICSASKMDISSDTLKTKVKYIPSINHASIVQLVESGTYDAIVINGTRIIGKEFLKKIKKPIINTHVGVTPIYRGVHGAYWALVNNDRANCGVTVHLVDTGIDTGAVLGQARINISKDDTFATYPYLQIAAALPLLKQAIKNQTIRIDTSGIKSQLWYHPTIFEYLKYYITKKVK